MDTARFDRLTRSASILLPRGTRRGLLGFLTTLPLVGGLAALFEDEVDAQGRRRRRKKRHKHGRGRRRQHHNKTKPKFNAFGCVDVGKFCKNSRQCCSGICQGKKGKKTCQAHDAGNCQPGHTQLDCGGENVPCLTSAGIDGWCDTTTGKAAFCSVHKAGLVPRCTRDADCQVFDPGAACILCSGVGTHCAMPV